MKYNVLIIVAIFVLLNATAAAATGPNIGLYEREGNIVVVLQNLDESQIMWGNATLTLPQGHVETFEFSLNPQEKKEWKYTPKATGYASLNTRYHLGNDDLHMMSLTNTVTQVPTKQTKTQQSRGFESAIGLIPLAIFAILRHKEK